MKHERSKLAIFVGELLRCARKEKHLTQVELGNRLNLTKARISDIERGSSLPSMLVIHEWCEAIDEDPIIIILKGYQKLDWSACRKEEIKNALSLN